MKALTAEIKKKIYTVITVVSYGMGLQKNQ